MTDSTESFSQRLVKAGTPIFEEILKHPFVQGIANGDLSKEALTFYVGQDFNYLNAFIKVYAGAIQKCVNRKQMAFFSQQIGFVLNSEIHPHHNFCDVAGVEYESLQHEAQAPFTYLYNEHMYNAARTGDLIDVVAAMTPCPWTYIEIGNELVREGKNGEDNVFKPWIDFYANFDGEGDSVLPKMFELLDTEAPKYREEHLKRTEEIFLKSCELEWEFWDQAWNQRGWRFVKPSNVL
ncbi:thiaminase II [Bifidobacterium simiarum]|uniref:thiaminase II n=1 Tax=Bifidobacterium simiarum TaxID=2045441 RepID=UPI001BDCBCB1|nr:thiaminase II [Bifidobacterium simiarum]MBT1165238.1 thiaminase II [Bifidobacterium simiarum]